MMKTSYKQFDAKPEKYIPFREWWVNYFGICSDNEPQGQGLLGFVLSLLDYAALRGVLAAFNARPDPELRPVLGPSPNAAALGLHKDQIAIWEIETREFKEEQKALAKDKIDFIDNIHESCFPSPDHGSGPCA